MMIIGCDYHPGFQQIAFVDTASGELQERRLQHREEAEKFYRDLGAQGVKVRVGMEASGHARWFERLLSELQFELWTGDAAAINAKRVRKQKTDRQDAQLILRLMLKDDFPQIWVPSWESRSAATAVASTSDGAGPHADHESTAGRGAERRTALQEAIVARRRTRTPGVVCAGSVGEPATARSAGVARPTDADDCRVDGGHRAGSKRCPDVQRLQTHPGVGALTALAFVLIIGRAERFQCGKQIACYLGLVPLEDSSGQRRRLGHITKQGNSLLRFLLVEAAQVTVRSLPEWRSKYCHMALRRGRKIAKVARARKLAVRLYWMMRKEWDYTELSKFGSHAGKPGNRHGVKQNTE
jgi:transposase